MTEAEFWNLIAHLDWGRTGDDEAVVEPVVESLSSRDVADIEAFEELLAHKLFSLDTVGHARAIGKYAFKGSDEGFSVDLFLYARCCVVANGRKFFEQVLADPSKMPKDMEFEALLSVAAKAHERKTGESFDFVP